MQFFFWLQNEFHLNTVMILVIRSTRFLLTHNEALPVFEVLRQKKKCLALHEVERFDTTGHLFVI